ncbi:family 28 glycoside hydrolase [Cryphonectria parasitica EP155]|uniref:endo-polygalacturonase n=1 Tax=Cryphonectria parasitica (strain ATCC 38755 / EP155) TaxID=660469 RepID=A0A9P4XZG9_CRYP1|nr:family 28 glycoside hydrolase [Cryphonectria parasitica EP155]KAF3763858.1 family 28 glycoside hydrolase [Cryphonectria parasitica EP155]
MKTRAFTLAAVPAVVLANTLETSKPTSTDSTAATTCVVTSVDEVASAVASCTAIELANLTFPADTALDLTGLQDNTVVTFSGTTSFGYTPDADFDPITVSGSSITITGATGHVIDGNGAAYWDGQGSNGGSDKPDHFFVVQDMENSVIQDLYIQNWPTHLFYMSGNAGLTVTGLVLNNSAGDAPNSLSDGLAAAHNSDGFDISSSSDVTLSNIQVYNQDDCVAVTSGTNITVSDMYCSGGHGLSIGSIGGKSDNTVDGVIFENSVVINSQNGVRIKTNSGTTGSVNNVTYRNISMSGISIYGLDVQQDYLNGGPTGIPTNGVNVTNIVFDDVTGTVLSDAYDYYILCAEGSCSDFTFTNVDISGGNESCNYPTDTCP